MAWRNGDRYCVVTTTRSTATRRVTSNTMANRWYHSIRAIECKEIVPSSTYNSGLNLELSDSCRQNYVYTLESESTGALAENFDTMPKSWRRVQHRDFGKQRLRPKTQRLQH